jgi:hypothetical protein
MKLIRTKHPLDALRAAVEDGATCMSQSDLLRACYGPDVDSRCRVGNSGRIAGIKRALAKCPEVIAFGGSNGGTLYGLVREHNFNA